jgi:hypothetical protein
VAQTTRLGVTGAKAAFLPNRGNDRFVAMRGGIFKQDPTSRRLLRALIGVVVAYAVAAQSLLIALGGFSLAAHAAQSAPALELCLHDSQALPEVPASNPDHSGCTYCIFCFAGSHHAALEAAPTVFHRVRVETFDTPWVAHRQHLPGPTAYAIASPRGPPLGA